jgi:hypothetical protein
MGHTRLGRIPKTRKWAEVVRELTSSLGSKASAGGLSADEVAKIASKALSASERGIQQAISDEALVYSFYLLTQLALTGRNDDWQSHLGSLGIQLSESDTLFDLTSQLTSSIDTYLDKRGRHSDLSEICQRAVGESVSSCLGDKVVSLFGEGKGETIDALMQLGTKNRFADLGQRFFAAFMTKYLNFYLSRVTAEQTNGIANQTSFNQALQTHCYQSARIVHDFCGQWFSKTEFEQGIDLENSARFVAVAMKKLRSELEAQRSEE